MTVPDLRTREEAVNFLRGLGFHAEERDWVMGQTIAVASELIADGEIKVWRRIVYIAATPEGWVVYEQSRPNLDPIQAGSLTHACEVVVKTLEQPLP